jgi:hypothetical protein
MHKPAQAPIDVEELARRTETYERGGIPEPPVEVTVCHAPQAPVHLLEDHAAVCMTHSEIDAWWGSLTLDCKAEVLMNHYASLAADNQTAKETA